MRSPSFIAGTERVSLAFLPGWRTTPSWRPDLTRSGHFSAVSFPRLVSRGFSYNPCSALPRVSMFSRLRFLRGFTLGPVCVVLSAVLFTSSHAVARSFRFHARHGPVRDTRLALAVHVAIQFVGVLSMSSVVDSRRICSLYIICGRFQDVRTAFDAESGEVCKQESHFVLERIADLDSSAVARQRQCRCQDVRRGGARVVLHLGCVAPKPSHTRRVRLVCESPRGSPRAAGF
ncbi:hypothetical protein OH77DRAFT_1025882 [Trametes cingulata]|nr:hypothetical protein OH77DRAFT_1025882 [Trametes cingulata]